VVPGTAWEHGLSPLRVHLTALTKGWAAAAAEAEPVLADPELDKPPCIVGSCTHAEAPTVIPLRSRASTA
jgi:hypothetical protein